MKGTFPFDFSWAKTVDQVLPYPLVRLITCREPQPFKSIFKKWGIDYFSKKEYRIPNYNIIENVDGIAGLLIAQQGF